MSQQQAEDISLSFVERHVIVVAQSEDTRDTVPEYDKRIVSAVDRGDTWQVSVQISGIVNYTQKEKTVTVEVDRNSGKVVRFNGMPVP